MSPERRFRLLAVNLLESAQIEVDDCVSPEQLLRVLIDTNIAVAYATLAVAGGAAELCGCDRKPYPHTVSPRCGARPMPPPTSWSVEHSFGRPGECEETDHDHYGDCDGPVTVFNQNGTGMGRPVGSKVQLCRSHARQASNRGAIRWVLSDGPGQ